MEKSRHIVFVTGSRADYGLMSSVLKKIKSTKGLKLSILATGMHLMHEFGDTFNEIVEDGFSPIKLESTYLKDDKSSAVDFLSKFLSEINVFFRKNKIDCLLIIGDRAEMLGSAIAANYNSIPIAHVHGGEVSSTVDEHVRHAISKLSHIHFVATEKSLKRLERMGEKKENIIISGAPGLFFLRDKKYLFTKEELKKITGIDFNEKTLLILQHPVTVESHKAGDQMRMTLEAAKSIGLQSVVIYPNADSGGREMIKIIKEYEKIENFYSFPNLKRKLYLSMLRHSSVLIGNSSSGLIEASHLSIPVINIGERQSGREKSSNIIDTQANIRSIKENILKLLNNDFVFEAYKNPYLKYNSEEIIVETLLKIEFNNDLIQKKITY